LVANALIGTLSQKFVQKRSIGKAASKEKCNCIFLGQENSFGIFSGRRNGINFEIATPYSPTLSITPFLITNVLICMLALCWAVAAGILTLAAVIQRDGWQALEFYVRHL
jgi:hypothetical protein